MKKNKILFLPLVLALVLVMIGCTVNRPGTQTRIGRNTTDNLGVRRNNNMLGIERRNDDGVGVNRRNLNELADIDRRDNNRIGRVPGDNNMNNLSRRANSIARRIAQLNEVNRCSVLLSGDTAIVGVDMANNLEGRMTTELKQKIENIVKDMDNNIKNVSITADPDLFTRISNMARDIRDGRPITGFANQFQEILRRITPIR
ncbi:MAG: YhcN/YlaJ family sporulation lipoprotein [Tissierellia bacterium]|nr:YhcN/YlaJ family sporulation lipoprotein [Tissierellia bacterium]